VRWLRAALAAAGLALAGAASAQQAGPPEWLRQLDLSAAQQQDVLRIFTAQAPALRDRLTTARRAHEQLESLALAGRIDSDEARELADAEDEALGEVSQLRLQAMVQVYRLLTEEQQAQGVQMRFSR
jgi:Spy/CpxP family protein refolding chaperone